MLWDPEGGMAQGEEDAPPCFPNFLSLGGLPLPWRSGCFTIAISGTERGGGTLTAYLKVVIQLIHEPLPVFQIIVYPEIAHNINIE